MCYGHSDYQGNNIQPNAPVGHAPTTNRRHLNSSHQVQCCNSFSNCFCNSIKAGSKSWMFELLVKIIVQMSDAVVMRTTRERPFNGIEETFLAIRDEGECLTEISSCMFVNNFTK